MSLVCGYHSLNSLWSLRSHLQLKSFCLMGGNWHWSLTYLINKFFFSIPQYIILLILVFLFELSAGAVAYIYERNVSDELNMTLSDTIKNNYAISERVTKAVDLMQQNFKCCGAIRFGEYNESLWIKSTRDDLLVERDGRFVPDSCCVTMNRTCGRSFHPSNIPYTVRFLTTSWDQKF